MISSSSHDAALIDGLALSKPNWAPLRKARLCRLVDIILETSCHERPADIEKAMGSDLCVKFSDLWPCGTRTGSNNPPCTRKLRGLPVRRGLDLPGIAKLLRDELSADP